MEHTNEKHSSFGWLFLSCRTSLKSLLTSKNPLANAHQTNFRFSGTQCERVHSIGSISRAVERKRITGSQWRWLGGRWNKWNDSVPSLHEQILLTWCPRRFESGRSGARETAGGERSRRSLPAPSSLIHTVWGLILHFYLQSFKSPLSPNIKQSRRPGGERRRGGGVGLRPGSSY